MKKNLLSFAVIGLLGSFWHFLYTICGMNTLVGVFAPVNESVFEHLKLLFWPPVIYFVAERLITGSNRKNGAAALLFGILSAMITTVMLYYTYSGITGKNIDFINITIYFISVAVLLFVRFIFIKNKILTGKTAQSVCILLLFAIALLLCVFTFYPPDIPLFMSPD